LSELGETDKAEGRVLSSEEISRLEAMLTKFRNLEVEDDDPLSKTAPADLKLVADTWQKRRQKGNVLLPEDLKEQKGQVDSDGQKQEKTEEGKLLLPEFFPAENSSQEEMTEPPKLWVSSPFPSRLEIDVLLKENAKESAESGVVEEKAEENERPSSEMSRVPGQEGLIAPAFSGETSPRSELPAESDEIQDPPQGKTDSSSRAAANTYGDSADRSLTDGNSKESKRLSGGESAREAQAKPRTEERKTGFEQFFDGVRRDGVQGDAFREGLNLAKDAPLPRNEALREGLDNVVRFIRVSGEQKAALIVDPPALGRVSVELTHSAVGLEASIKVGSEQVRQLIQDQLAQLRWSLAQQGVQLTHFSVDVQQDNERREQGRSSERRRVEAAAGTDDGEGEGEETMFRVDLDQGLLYWVA
jgi:flagellar hook-length control protein FliK